MPPVNPHPVLAAVLVALAVWHVRSVAGESRRRALLAWIVLALVTLWPIGDLASSVSLSIATAQRLVIMLGVAPLLLTSTSTLQLVRLTRPAPVDAVTRRLAHPGAALVFVTLVGTVTLSTPVVDEGAHSSLVRAATLLLVLLCGIVLWVPALGVLPGARRLSPVGRAGFLFASSLVVTSMSFVWIFSTHSLYPALHGQEALLHVTPVFDQQLAGFVAKLGAFIPMWSASFVVFSRAVDAGDHVEESPLHWADVERQLLRVDRQRARWSRRHANTGEGAGPQE